MKKIILGIIIGAVLVISLGAIGNFLTRTYLRKGFYKFESVSFKMPDETWNKHALREITFQKTHPEINFNTRITFVTDDVLVDGAIDLTRINKIRDQFNKNMPGFTIEKEEMVKVSNHDAIKFIFQGKAKGHDVRGIQVFVSQGSAANFISFSADSSVYDEDVKYFNGFIESLNF